MSYLEKEWATKLAEPMGIPKLYENQGANAIVCSTLSATFHLCGDKCASVHRCIRATEVSSGFRTQLRSDGVTCALPSVTALLQDFRKVSFQREIEFTSTSLCADSVADVYCLVFLSPPVYKVNVRNEAVWAHRRNKCVVAAIQSNGAMIWKR